MIIVYYVFQGYNYTGGVNFCTVVHVSAADLHVCCHGFQRVVRVLAECCQSVAMVFRGLPWLSQCYQVLPWLQHCVTHAPGTVLPSVALVATPCYTYPWHSVALVATPLSVTVYTCSWHSVIHLSYLKAEEARL